MELSLPILPKLDIASPRVYSSGEFWINSTKAAIAFVRFVADIAALAPSAIEDKNVCHSCFLMLK